LYINSVVCKVKNTRTDSMIPLALSTQTSSLIGPNVVHFDVMLPIS